jgi:hypothetical protein
VPETIPTPRFVWRDEHWAALAAAAAPGGKSAAKLAAELAKSDIFRARDGRPAAVLNSATVRREYGKIQDQVEDASGHRPPDLPRAKAEPDGEALAGLFLRSPKGGAE